MLYGSKKDWNLPFKGNEVKLEVKGHMENQLYVVVDRTPREKGELECTYYSGRTFADEVELTAKRKLPNITVDMQKMKITILPPAEVNVVKYNYGFAISQFAEHHFRKKSFIRNSYYVSFGDDYLYLRVPKGVNVKGPDSLKITDADVN